MSNKNDTLRTKLPVGDDQQQKGPRNISMKKFEFATKCMVKNKYEFPT